MDASDGITEIGFDDLYRKHVRRIAGYVQARVPAAYVDDVVSDTFLVAWRRRAEIPPEPHINLWLFAVARRVIADHRRALRRRRRLVERLIVLSMNPSDAALEHAALEMDVVAILAARLLLLASACFARGDERSAG
jgi:DNA-directed RNA polymerase specialized sigma24 family protein